MNPRNKIGITFFNNFFDTCVSVHECMTWDELCSVFFEHDVRSDKDGTMFNLCTFKDLDGIRCSDNVDCYHGLLLDYDGNGATIPSIIERFDGFCYFGYTSHNHVIKGVDKFRLIFPFTKPCPKNEWDSRKENFLEFAGCEIDRSCVSHSRSFYTPSCPSEAVQYADRWIAEGELLDWEIFVPVKKVYVEQKIQKPVSVTDLQKALDELKKHKDTLPNEERYKLVRAVAKCCGATQAILECRSRWPDAAYNGKYEQQVKNLKADGPGMGGIIHEIRKYNPDYGKLSREEWKLNELVAKIEKKLLNGD